MLTNLRKEEVDRMAKLERDALERLNEKEEKHLAVIAEMDRLKAIREAEYLERAEILQNQLSCAFQE